MEHTSLPWEVGYHATGNKRDGCLVYDKESKVHIAGLWASLRPVGECDANAEFIVRACNAHEDLLKALNGIITAHELNLWKTTNGTDNAVLNKIKQAIAKAQDK